METKRNNRAVIYARVSSKEQEDTGYSLPAQEKYLREYAARPDVGLDVVEVFRISESASGKVRRKIFDEMLDYIRRNDIDVVIVETTDRLTRNFADAIKIDAWVVQAGRNQIHLTKEGCVLHRDAKSHEWFMWRVKVATAEYYVKLLSENVRKGQKEKVAQGGYPTKPPLGYKTIGDKGHKVHVIDEDTAPYVRQMFALYATGNYSLLALGRKLYELGFRSRGGGRVVKSKIHKLLSDPFYCGKFVWKGREHQGTHEALITRDLFGQVQAKLVRSAAPYYSKHAKELRAKTFCGECDKTITWENQKGHSYGGCKQCKTPMGADRKYIRQEAVERHLLAQMASIAPKSERVLEVLREALRESHKEEIEAHDAQEKGINASLERINQRKRAMYDDRLDARISPEFYDEKLKSFKDEEEMLTESLKRLKSDNTEYYRVGFSIHELALRAGQIYQSEKATIEERRALLSYAFEKITILRGVVTPEYTKGFGFLAKWMPRVNEILEPEQNVVNTFIPSGDLSSLAPEFLSELAELKNNSRTEKTPAKYRVSRAKVPQTNVLLRG